MNKAEKGLLEAMRDGAVLHVAGAIARLDNSRKRVDPHAVISCARKRWIYETRKPVVSGSSHTGRFRISAKGKQMLHIQQRSVSKRRRVAA